MWKIYVSLFVVAVVMVLGCGRPISEEERQVRDVATKYRDAYVDGFSVAGSAEIATNLARGTIQSVNTWSNGWDNGWDVVFATKTNGKPGYILHVYVKPDGGLKQIVR